MTDEEICACLDFSIGVEVEPVGPGRTVERATVVCAVDRDALTIKLCRSVDLGRPDRRGLHEHGPYPMKDWRVRRFTKDDGAISEGRYTREELRRHVSEVSLWNPLSKPKNCDCGMGGPHSPAAHEPPTNYILNPEDWADATGTYGPFYGIARPAPDAILSGARVTAEMLDRSRRALEVAGAGHWFVGKDGALTTREEPSPHDFLREPTADVYEVRSEPDAYAVRVSSPHEYAPDDTSDLPRLCRHIALREANADGIECTDCGIFISRQALRRLPVPPRVANDSRANALADTCGRLEDENRALLVENATLRRAVERLERKR